MKESPGTVVLLTTATSIADDQQFVIQNFTLFMFDFANVGNIKPYKERFEGLNFA